MKPSKPVLKGFPLTCFFILTRHCFIYKIYTNTTEQLYVPVLCGQFHLQPQQHHWWIWSHQCCVSPVFTPSEPCDVTGSRCTLEHKPLGHQKQDLSLDVRLLFKGSLPKNFTTKQHCNILLNNWSSWRLVLKCEINWNQKHEIAAARCSSLEAPEIPIDLKKDYLHNLKPKTSLQLKSYNWWSGSGCKNYSSYSCFSFLYVLNQVIRYFTCSLNKWRDSRSFWVRRNKLGLKMAPTNPKSITPFTLSFQGGKIELLLHLTICIKVTEAEYWDSWSTDPVAVVTEVKQCLFVRISRQRGTGLC